MAASAGLNRVDGKSLTDWNHVAQSLTTIFTTPIGSRVMRREFGSEVPFLIDRPMDDVNLLKLYAAMANAVLRWEPRFRLTHCQYNRVGPDGVIGFSIAGIYMPRGHLGDTTPAESQPVFIPLRQGA